MSLTDPLKAEQVRRQQALELFNTPQTTAPATNLNAQESLTQEAKVRQELDTPRERLDEGDAFSQKGYTALRELPASPQHAVNQAAQEGVRIPNTPAYAKKVKDFAAGWQYLLARREGLLSKEGNFTGEVSDELLEEIHQGFLAYGARVLADLTEEELDATSRTASTNYLERVRTLGIAKRNEVFEKHKRSRDEPSGPNNLLLEGVAELGRIDEVLNAVQQLEKHKDKDAVISGYRSLLSMSHAKMRSSESVDEDTKKRLGVRDQTIKLSMPESQDATRLLFEGNAPLLSRLQGEQLPMSGPVVQFAKTLRLLEEVTDPTRPYQFVANAYEGAVRIVRSQRMGVDPNLDPIGTMYSMFPSILGQVADTKLRNSVRKEVGADELSFNPRAYQARLNVARRERLPGVVDASIGESLDTLDGLFALETEASRGSVPDLEAKTMQALGTTFGAFAENFGPPARFWINTFDGSTRGTPEGHRDARRLLRRGRDQLRTKTENFQTHPFAMDDQQIEEEAAALNQTGLTTEQREARMLLSRQRGAMRGLLRRDVGIQQREAIDAVNEVMDPDVRALMETFPDVTLDEAKQAQADKPERLLNPDKPEDRVIPLAADYTNLEEFLESAAEEGTIPWRDGRILLTESRGTEAVENMAAVAFSVLAPQTLQRMVRAGMGVPEIQKLQKEATAAALDDKVIPGMTTAELDELTDGLVNKMAGMSPFERARPANVVRLAWARLHRDLRTLTSEFVQNPTQITDLLVGTAPLGAIGGAAAKLPLNKLQRGLKNISLSSRLRRSISDVAATDPDAAHSLRTMAGQAIESISEATDGFTTDKQRKLLESWQATADVAATIAAEDAKGTLGARINGQVRDAKKVSQSARKLRRTLREINVEDLDRLATNMDIPEHARGLLQDIRSPIMQVVQAVQQNFAEWMNIDSLSLRPWVAEKAQLTFNTVLDAVNKGNNLDPSTMPISLEALALPKSKAQLLFNTPLKEFFKPEAKKVVDGIGDYANKVVDFVANYYDDAVAVNFLQAEGRATMQSLHAFAKQKFVGEMTDLNVLLPNRVFKEKLRNGTLTETDVEVQNLKRDLAQKISRVKGDKRAVDGKGWDQPITMANADYLDDLTDADFVLWGRHIASSDPHEFYRSVALAGETFDEFEARLVRVLSGSEDPKDSIGLRKAITRRYLNAPGISSKQRFDTITGLPLNAQQAANLAKRRRSVRKARAKYEEKLDLIEELHLEKAELTDPDEIRQVQLRIRSETSGLNGIRKRARFEDPEFVEEVLGANLGLSQKDLKGPYKELVSLAKTENAASMARRIEMLGNLSDGRMSSKVQLAKDAAKTAQFQMVADQQHNAFFAKRLSLLSDAERKDFDMLLAVAQDTGDARKLAAKARKNKKIGALLDRLEADPNKKVLRLVEESNSFRQNLLRAARDSGVIDAPTFDDLIGPYAPHQFLTNEWRSLMGKVFDDPDLFSKPTDLGLDMSEMLRQKHFKKYKGVVYIKGGRKTTRLFDTEQQARDWVTNTYGVKGKTKTAQAFGKGAGVLEGKTKLDDTFAILEPLGQDRADALGFLGEGTSLIKRLDTLVRDIHRSQILQSLDRPGFTMTAAEYAQRLETKDGTKVASQFSSKPLEDIRTNGPMRGKHIHKKVQRVLEDTDFFGKVQRRIEDVLKDKAEDAGLFAGLGLGSLAALAGGTRKLKQALVTNRIARAAKTIFYNFMMDSELFATTAAGRDFSILNPAGRAARSQAWKDITAIMKEGDVRPSELYFEALEDGVIDDVLMMGTMEPKTRQFLNRVVFGETKDFGGSPGDRLGRAISGQSDDPQIRKLQERHDEIEMAISRQAVVPKSEEFASLVKEKAAIETLLEKEQGTKMYQRVQRGIREVNDAFVADKNLGKFEDTEVFSREMYGRVSNVNRLAAYYHLRKKGFTRQLAVERINTFMQHYSGVPDIIKSFGSSLLGSPIVAFPYEQIRIMFNMARYQPGALLGIMGGIGASNFMTMVASGLDPYRVMTQMEQDNAGFPPLFAFMSSFIVPHADGTFSSIQVPGLNFYQVTREPFGLQREMLDLDDRPDLDVPGLLRNVATKFIMGQPTLQLAYGAATGRDPRTGSPAGQSVSFTSSLCPLSCPLLGPMCVKSTKVYDAPLTSRPSEK
jgi:hypothetical protein